MRETPDPISAGDKRWLAACLLVALAAFAVRAGNGLAMTPFADFDGGGYALYTFSLYEGRAPDPRSWSGFHAPLYFVAGALAWHVLPDALPMHVSLRWLSLLFGAATLVLVYRTLAKRLPVADAAVVSLLAWCVPFVAIASSMSGNETLCAFLVTLLLVRSLHPVETLEAAQAGRAALLGGVIGGLALLAKPTAAAAIGAVGLDWLRRLRGCPPRMLRCAALFGIATLVVAAPHYLLLSTRSQGLAPEVREMVAKQPPGERRIADYVSLPAATLLAPVYSSPGLVRSIPGLLYASAWADAHNHFLSDSWPSVARVQVALCFAGLLPTGLLALGGLRLLRRSREHEEWFAAIISTAALLLAFGAFTWTFPNYTAVKAKYFLAAILPGSYLLALGLATFRGSVRNLLRFALVAVSIGATAATRWGWWL